MTAPLPTIRVDGPALISRMSDEGVIVVEPLRVIRHNGFAKQCLDIPSGTACHRCGSRWHEASSAR